VINFATPAIDDDEVTLVSQVIKSGWLTTGQLTKEFAEELKKITKAKYCLPVSSCTAALHLALICAGVKKGDEVITSPFTFVSTANAITYLGAKPVLVDIKPNDYIIDEDKIEKAITKKTKAIIPVHYGGFVANLTKLRKLAKKYQLEIIEDAAHSFGSKYKEEIVGENSKFACFSFYPTKNITTIEGGAIVTNDKEVFERASSLSLHGISKDAWNRYAKAGTWQYNVEEIGFKYNMTDVQAAVGLAQIKKLNVFKKKREKIFNYYQKEIENTPGIDLLTGNLYSTPFRHLCVLKLNPKVINRDVFLEKMKEKNIICSVHFIPLYRFEIYKKLYSYNETNYPAANSAFEECISIPFSSSLTMDEAKTVISTTKDVINQISLSGNKDKFLSEVFGIDCFNLKKIDDNFEYQPNSFYSYIGEYEVDQLERCQKNGFTYISSRLQLKYKSKNNQNKKNIFIKANKYDKQDQESIKKISREIEKVSRFYKDNNLRAKVRSLYSKWIHNSLSNGYTDDCLVVRKKGNIIGFVTLRIIDDSCVSIDLIVVDDKHQGKGVGSKLIDQIKSKYKYYDIEVGTEAENKNAVKFYINNEFEIKDYQVVLHKHT
jgi:dTDP-4-amino-4,6-dideoxygalactose transaminase/ribosomal protein S18 acetylase RimI-like enzyme